MSNRDWQDASPRLSYNNWLREEAVDSKSTLLKNMDRLQAQLPVLESLISQGEITTARFERVSQALIHVMTEIHLLVILTEEK